MPKKKVILNNKQYSNILRTLKRYCDVGGFDETENIQEFRKSFAAAKQTIASRPDLCELRFSNPIKPIIQGPHLFGRSSNTSQIKHIYQVQGEDLSFVRILSD